MSAPAYMLTNLLSSAAALSSSTEDSTYVLENLFDQIAANPFAFTLSTGGHIEIDHGSAKPYNTVAVINHNLTSSGTIIVKGGSSANPGTTIGASQYRSECMWWDVGSRNERYTRLVVADTNSANVFIGEILIGTRVALPHQTKWGRQKGREEADILHETQRGVVWVYKLFHRETRVFPFEFPESEYSTFKLLHTAVRGKQYPFLYVPDVALTEVLYGRKEQSFMPEAMDQPGDDGGMAHRYKYNLEFTEESFGVEVLA